jgi:hypothetical protein
VGRLADLFSVDAIVDVDRSTGPTITPHRLLDE